ncbi:hypothetical protein [Hydrogenophaga sp.]|jgi:hypothetical protein|uniref:hypothetical protein n=1 Tax=Hydrogenophaga sp. TaxID=1904254 RepID=UPI00262B5AC6|nr:hypothetical protein [Hydrogenophaga sp.]MDM7950052.1 hypothetical protein [Hydrogenophaga sp.]
MPLPDTADPPALPAITRRHHQRLREVYRSAGWPCADMLEVELLAAGLLERRCSPEGFETLRLTGAGIQALAKAHAGNRASRSPHEALVAQVAEELGRAGRLAWRGLSLRVALPRDLLEGEPAIDAAPVASEPHPLWPVEPTVEAAGRAPDRAWCMAMPDVFSIRRSSVEAYLEPVVHEIKVSRADLLGDLKRPAKRAAYLAMAGACWYVLGRDAKGRPIAEADEVPAECGVMIATGSQLEVARPAPRRAVERLPLQVWMSLAQAAPAARPEEDAQGWL